MKLKNRLMLDLLKEEVEALKGEAHKFDEKILDTLYANVAFDVYKDDMWGVPLGAPSDTLQALNQDWNTLPSEYIAFIEAGLRALSRLGDTLRTHRHSPA